MKGGAGPGGPQGSGGSEGEWAYAPGRVLAMEVAAALPAPGFPPGIADPAGRGHVTGGQG